MAAAATSPFASSVEKTNGVKLSRLLIDGGTTVLRSVFDGFHPPANLAADLNANLPILNNLFTKKVLRKPQWDLLFPPAGATPDSNTFDITLLFVLLTNICGLSPPLSGWHKPPPSSDASREANLARIKLYRNELYGHVTSTGVQTSAFNLKWQEISAVLIALGLNPAEVVKLKAAPCGEDYINVVIEWAKSDGEISSQLAQVRKTQCEARQRQEEDHETIQEIKEMLTTQQEVVKTLQEVNERVERVEEGSNKDKDNDILTKLAEVNSQKVIDDHAETYQEGTRLFFFESVEKWLDDRSSPNRVMVISGNAGMGKSVIAAVICKRMQEVGRLSGSHFCQHDKARYRNPKVMLQSLACQLSYSLPEYKEALVKTLSRNLGVELNHMEVKDLFDLLFDELLSKLEDPGRNILLVVDGLDESEYQGRNELLDVISNHFIKLPRWIRFLVTTRPEINIADCLKSFNPLQLEPNDAENLMDIKLLFEKQLNDVIPQHHQEIIINTLVKKSKGLILYAYLLVHFIKENVSLLTPGQLDNALPSGMSSVYQTYFRRLERELCKELKIKEELFLSFLGALTVTREPLPLEFVNKMMLSDARSSADRRKVKKAIACISTLLPVRDDRIHFFHKSVRDWLIETFMYGQHDFTVDETEGHRILSELCTHELDNVKRKGVESAQLNDAAKYALQHGVQHMLYLEEDARVCEVVVKEYVVDLQLVYAKLCVSNAGASEDILWIQKQKISQDLSEDIKGTLSALLFLLRKYICTYYNAFTNHPHIFFQTVLNEGGTALSPLAWNLLQEKYTEKAFMEYVHKQTKQGALIARFQCSSQVACFDVSPQLDYMVCECKDGTIQLWSLHTGKQVWVQPVVVLKNCWDDATAFRKSPYSPAVSCYRSVVFHPEENIVLPGVLSHAYTFDGDLEALFPQSLCRFTVCSISGDKTTMLTDCPDDTKCIIMWSLKNGTEITRTTRNDNVLSFAWSPDERLMAISHSTGLICFVDVRDGFRTVLEGYFKNHQAVGMIMFSPDCRSLFCFRVTGRTFLKSCRLNVNGAKQPSSTSFVWRSLSPCCRVDSEGEARDGEASEGEASEEEASEEENSEEESSEGEASEVVQSLPDLVFDFVLDTGEASEEEFSDEESSEGEASEWEASEGDLLFEQPLFDLAFDFVLDTLTGLRGYPYRSVLDMFNISEVRSLIPWKTRPGVVPPPFRSLTLTGLGMTRKVAFSLTGKILYVIRSGARCQTATAWDVSSEKRVGRVGDIFVHSCLEARMKEGVLLSTAMGCLEMWNFALSNCIRRWPKLVKPMEITQVVPISEERVALSCENKVIILNTTTSEIVSIPNDHGDFVTCNSKCQLLTRNSGSVQLLNKQVTLWKTDLRRPTLFGKFSLSERFVVICANTQEGDRGMYVLDAFSGEILLILCKGDWFPVDCQFVSDEECVINSRTASGSSLQLFNIESGELLTVIDLERPVFHLAVGSRKRLLAIDQKDSEFGVELIQVHLPRDKDSRKGELLTIKVKSL